MTSHRAHAERPNPITFLPVALMLLRLIWPWDGGKQFLLGLRQGYDLVLTTSASSRPLKSRIAVGTLALLSLCITSDSLQPLIRGIRVGFGVTETIASLVSPAIDRP